MRLISDEMLDLIAGGSSEASIPSVTIVGNRDDWGGGWGGGGGYGGYGGYGGSAPGSTSGSTPVSAPEPPHDCPLVHSSPVPANAPKDVDMNELRNTMLDVASQIKAMDKAIEHGAIVVRAADGALRVGEMAHGNEFEIAISVGLRAGDVIVGYIHSHPEDQLNQTLPSRHDFTQAAELREKPYTDKGMMLYILDNASGDVFEYRAGTPHNTTRSGANITDDTSKPCG